MFIFVVTAPTNKKPPMQTALHFVSNNTDGQMQSHDVQNSNGSYDGMGNNPGVIQCYFSPSPVSASAMPFPMANAVMVVPQPVTYGGFVQYNMVYTSLPVGHWPNPPFGAPGRTAFFRLLLGHNLCACFNMSFQNIFDAALVSECKPAIER